MEAIDNINLYTTDLSQEQFLSDQKTKDAVIRNFEIIGEAANKISEDFSKKNLSIDWKGVIGLRNVLIHDYFGIDYNIVWNITKIFLPDFKSKLKSIISTF
jgi:uncharacterized protein with HEPN domain